MNAYMIQWRTKGQTGAHTEIYYADNTQQAVDKFREDYESNFCNWYIAAVYKETRNSWEYRTDWD